MKYYPIARKRALYNTNKMSAWRKTGLIPLNPQEVLSKLPNRPSMPPQDTQLQLVVNGNAPLDLLIGAGNNYIEKATQAIQDTMLGSPAKHIVDTIEHLNVNNAILSKINADLVAASVAHKGTKKSKRFVNKARFLSKDDVDRLRTERETKNTADIAHKRVVEQKKHQQTLRKAQIGAEKA
jgi:hypothetical protein